MIKFVKIFLCAMGLAANLQAAIIVTKNNKLEAKITAEDEKSVTLTGVTGNVLVVPRDSILEIYDDNGKLVWQSTASTQSAAYKPGVPMSEQKPGFASHSILLDLYVGTAFGGFYSEEKRAMDSLGIYVRYSDGSIQSATNSYLSFGAGLSYQSYSSLRWSTLASYVYRSTLLRTTTGDGQKYKNETLASESATELHALFIGKEVHFYPGDGGSSFDIVGQVGYELGNYNPLKGYNALRTKLTPVPAQYIGPSNVFLHGPTARIGTGATFRGDVWQMRAHVYYQIAYTFASEQIWNAVSKNTILHDIYGALSFGYGW